MDESANKGLESKGGDAKSSISRMVVEGYDTTSPSREDVEESLRKHFASCGINLIHVSVPTLSFGGILGRLAFIYVNGECEEEALKLDGSEMGGQILQIMAYPFHEHYLDDYLAPMKESPEWLLQRTLSVTGYDPTLSLNDIECKLREHFSPPCFPREAGSVAYETDDGLKGAFVYLIGEDAVEKALQLSGISVGGSNIVVTRVLPHQPVMVGYSPAQEGEEETEAETEETTE